MRLLLRLALVVAAAGSPLLSTPVFFSGSGGVLADFDGGTPGVVSFVIAVPDTGLILSGLDNVRVRLLGFEHTFASDLEIILTFEPAGVSGTLFSQIGQPGSFSAANFFGNYDFASSNTDDLWATALALGDVDDIPNLFFFPTDAGSPLANNFSGLFAGLSPAGNWRLTIIDHAPGDSGSLLGWELTLDLEPASPAPEPVTAAFVLTGLAAMFFVGRRMRAK